MSPPIRHFCISLLAAAPVALLALSNGPPIMRTGAAIDGGMNCTACHQTFPVNSDAARGSVTIEARNYTPQIRQAIRVIVSHPDAARWGFQITARLARDESRQAGSFTADANFRVQCAPSGADAPCDGNLEFASHRAVSTTGGAFMGAKTFEIDWTPPATDLGDVIFYAAGNAANGNFANTGDRIYTTSLRIRADASCALKDRPMIQRIENGASFEPLISPNGMVSLRGLNFFPASESRLATTFDFVDGAFPKELACVSVEIDGRQAPVTYLQADQINAQVPSQTATGGPVSVRVTLNPGRPNELRSDAATVNSAPVAPAFFLFYEGRNPRSIAARHPDFSICADPAVVPGARPARPGDVVLLYGSGFGSTSPPFQAGEIARGLPRLTDQITVTVGGIAVAASDISYAGLTPDSISGLYQFNVRLPASLGDGDAPVSIRIGGTSTPVAGAVIPVRR